MQKISLTLFATATLFAACSNKTPSPGKLSAEENQFVAKLPDDANVQLAVVSEHLPSTLRHYVSTSPNTNGVLELSVPAAEVARVENEIVSASSDAVVTLNLPVTLNAFDNGLEPSEQLLFSGKEEFGVSDWNKAHPNADGRGVTVAIVDDGVALGRPGLLQTSEGKAKFASSFNVSPLWQLNITDKPSACAEAPKAAQDALNWEFENGVPKLKDAKSYLPFDITSCGINPLATRHAAKCADWSDALHGQKSFSAALARMENGKNYILVDFNGDKRIEGREVLEPISQNGKSYFVTETGAAFGFDVHTTTQLPTAATGLDTPVKTCDQDSFVTEVLTLAVPETENDFGSHGEGVASIATGYRIAGRNFDGVAPGAQVADIHFGDNFGGRRYTIAEVVRSLKTGGLNADVVNLSYSLFFSTPVAQVAMGRLMESALKHTAALYMFSAGNNGPGRGSMNRALLYPSFGIPVAAYLDPRMSQSTFGSPLPIGGVVTYSSRGPGVDGGPGALLLSPLAGIVAQTVDVGYAPFSGTSSATPALSGFAARVISQIKMDGLSFNRALLKRAMLLSAQPLPDAPFVDQGYGIPNLTRSFEIYKALLSQEHPIPQIIVTGDKTGQGVTRHGIYVRGDTDRSDVFAFTLAPKFDDTTPETDIANYAEHVTLSSPASWVHFPADAFVSVGEAYVQVAIDWDAMAGRSSNEFLTHIEVRNAESKELRAVIPITILRADTDTPQITLSTKVTPGGLVRYFLKKPTWARYLALSQESNSAEQFLCGRLSVYNPAGITMSAISSTGTGSVFHRERAYAASLPGLYEVTVEGRNNHQACPRPQSETLKLQWVEVEATAIAGNRANSGDTKTKVTMDVQVSTLGERASGRMLFDSPAKMFSLEFARQGNNPWERVANEKLDLSSYENVQFRFGDEFASTLNHFLGYAYWVLEMYTDPQVLPDGVGLNDTLWSSSMDVSSTAKEAEFVLYSFDIGIPSQPNASEITVIGRGTSKDAKNIKAEISSVQARADSPTVYSISIEGNAADLEADNTLLCSFQPDGFQVRIPCDTVVIP